MESLFITLTLLSQGLGFSTLGRKTISKQTPMYRRPRTALGYAQERDTSVPSFFLPNHDGHSHTNKKQTRLSKYDIAWNERYGELHQFYREHGHSDVLHSYVDKQLSRWVSNQRQNQKQERQSMTKERVQKLDQLNFKWEVRRTWDSHFTELETYCKRFNNGGIDGRRNSVRNYDGKYTHLVRFLAAQRRQYKLREMGEQSSLTDERLVALSSLGFEFNRTEVLDKTWNTQYQELKRFQEDNGHQCIPSKSQLWRWMDTQRIAYRNWKRGNYSPMTEERIRLLNEIEFIWNPSETRWNARLNELKAFIAENGHVQHCNEPSSAKLLKWLHEQRQLYHHGVLNDNHLESLQTLGIDLHSNAHSVTSKIAKKKRTKIPWEEHYRQLKEYAFVNGSCLVPQQYPPNPTLGQFVKAQRRQFKLKTKGLRSSLTQERLEKLNSIGFVWDAHGYSGHLAIAAWSDAIGKTTFSLEHGAVRKHWAVSP